MPSYIHVINNTPLYKSISSPYKRESIFEYNLFDSRVNKCRKISWFALTKEKADYYKEKSSSATVYEYTTKKGVDFLVTNFENSSIEVSKKMTKIPNKSIKVLYRGLYKNLSPYEKKHFQSYDYMQMTIAERAIYEYKFAFGHLDKKEQRKFIKLVLKLQEYKLIDTTRKMHGTNIFKGENKYLFKIARAWIRISGKLDKEKQFGNRFSLYIIDINIVNNLCLLFPKLNGYVYLHQKSIWHPKMEDTSEIAVFDVTNIIK